MTVVRRVRPFKRATACLSCCRRHAGGQFDTRFKFVKVAVVADSSRQPPVATSASVTFHEHMNREPPPMKL